MPAASVAATVAAAVAIASAMQPLLIALMPPTVAPALPWPAFIVIAAFAAVIAWQPAAFVTAWRSSRLRQGYGAAGFSPQTTQPRT